MDKGFRPPFLGTRANAGKGRISGKNSARLRVPCGFSSGGPGRLFTVLLAALVTALLSGFVSCGNPAGGPDDTGGRPGGLYEGSDTSAVNLDGYPGENVLAKAASYLNARALSGKEYTVVLDGDVETKGYVLSAANLNGAQNVTLTLAGSGGERIVRFLYDANTVSGFSVIDGNTLILERNLTLKGISGAQKSRGRLIFVNLGGVFIMRAGSKITGNEVGTSSPAGVDVSSTGTFIMEGGTISGNAAGPYGGGVSVSGVFTQKGGTITGNVSSSSSSVTAAGGGVYVRAGGTYNFEGGTVGGNSLSEDAAKNGPDVYVDTVKPSSAQASGGTLNLKGSGDIKVLLSDPGSGYVNVSGAFTGTAAISLSGSAADWTGRALVKAAGDYVLPSVPAGIEPGDFIDKTSHAATPVAPLYKLAFFGGEGVLRTAAAPPVETISWEEDGDGFIRFYTNDTEKTDRIFRASADNINSGDPETYSVECKKMGGYAETPYGMIFRFADDNFYAVLIDVNGRYTIRKRVGTYTTIQPWTASSRLREGYGVSNDIKAVKSASGFKIYFNNTEECELTRLDGAIDGDGIGFYVETGFEDEENFPDAPLDVRFRQK